MCCGVSTSNQCATKGRFCQKRGLVCQASPALPPSRKQKSGARNRPENAETDHTVNIRRDSHSPQASASIGPLYQSPEGHEQVVASSGRHRYTLSSPSAATTSSGSPFATVQSGNFESESPGDLGSNAVLPRSPPRSASNGSISEHSPVFTLEDGDNLTAHCIGLAGEQDTGLLASIRSIIVNEDNAIGVDVMQVFPGDSVAGEPPIHFSMVSNKFRPQDNIGIGRASDAIEGLVGFNGDRLVSLYFEHVHPVNCLVSKNRFLRAYESNRLSICASLRGAIYGLGAMFWNHDPAYHKLLSLDLYTMFEQAHYSLHRENHAPNLWTLQASLLLIHERPGDNFTMETPRTWLLSAQAVASAQMIGLHRDPKLWNVAPWEKHLRRKLWWATYTCDVWSSICHGNPPHIYINSFTTALVEISDFSADTEIDRESQYVLSGICVTDDIATCARFVEYVKLSQILHDLLNYF